MRRMQPQYAGNAPAPVAPSANAAWVTGTKNPFRDVGWTPAYVAFLVFVVGITTSRLALGTAAMAVALLTLPLEKRELRFPPLAMLVMALLGWSTLGLSMTAYSSNVIDGVTELTKVFLITFVAVNVLSNRGRMRVLFLAMLIGFALYPLRGTIMNYRAGITADGRVAWNNIYANPNDLAGLCLLQLSIALGMLEVEKSFVVKVFAWGMAIALPIIVIVTQSRGALIGLIVFALVLFRNHYRDVRKIAAGIVVIAVMITLAPQKAWDRLATMSKIQTAQSEELDFNDGATTSTAQRIEIWRVAFAVFEEQPLMGVGFGAYPEAHAVEARHNEFSRIARGKRDAHSTYLKLLAEVGIVGLALFLAIIWVTVKGSWRARGAAPKELYSEKMQLLYLEIGLYGYLVAGIWGSYGALSPTYLHFALMFATTQILKDDTQRIKEGPVRPRRRGGSPPAAPQMVGARG